LTGSVAEQARPFHIVAIFSSLALIVPDSIDFALMSLPRLIPVIDLKGGVVVRGIGGERGRYQPVISRLAENPATLSIANAIRHAFGLTELYLADLDALAGSAPNLHCVMELCTAGFSVLVDSGTRDRAAAERLLQAGASRIVAPLETLAGPHELEALVTGIGPDRIVFSLDLKGGRPLSQGGWGEQQLPLNIARDALRVGVQSMIILDLAGVGRGAGLTTLELVQALRRESPALELLTGGGIRGWNDVQAAGEAGVDGVLVASALHDGTLQPLINSPPKTPSTASTTSTTTECGQRE
jgi:phosphoribosylformimino-5-aminoimidazole carboxamide ribotide isomerase